MNSQFEDYDYERAAELRRLRRQKRRRKVMMMRGCLFSRPASDRGRRSLCRLQNRAEKGQRYIRHFGSGKNDTVSNVTVTEAPRETEAVPAAPRRYPAQDRSTCTDSDL